MRVLFLLTTVAVWLIGSFCGIAEAQNDLLVTSVNGDSIERYDGVTGDYLGAFVTAGSGGLDGPGSVAVGPDNNVYVTSSRTSQVLRYDGNTGDFIDVFASGGGMTAPNNLVFNGDYLYVGDFSGGANGFLRRYDAQTGAFVDNFADVDWADGIEFSTDSVFVSNYFGGVQQFDLQDGSYLGDFIEAGSGDLLNPAALLRLDTGEMLVSDYSGNAIKRYDANGDFVEDIIELVSPGRPRHRFGWKLICWKLRSWFGQQYDINTFEFIEEFSNTGPVTNFSFSAVQRSQNLGSRVCLFVCLVQRVPDAAVVEV